MHHRRKIAVPELDWRQFDADHQRILPGGCLATRFTQDPFADGDDEPAILAARAEPVGGDRASAGRSSRTACPALTPTIVIAAPPSRAKNVAPAVHCRRRATSRSRPS